MSKVLSDNLENEIAKLWYIRNFRNLPLKVILFPHYYTWLVSQRSWVRYPVWPHTFVSPSADSRGTVASYWRKYEDELLVNSSGGLSLPRKSVVWLTDRPDMTLDVYRGRKTTTRQQPHYYHSGHLVPKMTSYQRRCDVMTSHRRLYDVILRHLPA